METFYYYNNILLFNTSLRTGTVVPILTDEKTEPQKC